MFRISTFLAFVVSVSLEDSTSSSTEVPDDRFFFSMFTGGIDNPDSSKLLKEVHKVIYKNRLEE
jgi:hypothetical protein